MQPMIVSQCSQDRLLEKQLQARRLLNANPFARTLNCRLKIEMRNRGQRKMESKVLPWKRDEQNASK